MTKSHKILNTSVLMKIITKKRYHVLEWWVDITIMLLYTLTIVVLLQSILLSENVGIVQNKIKIKMKLLFVIHTRSKTIFNKPIGLTVKKRFAIGLGAKVKIICCLSKLFIKNLVKENFNEINLQSYGLSLSFFFLHK